MYMKYVTFCSTPYFLHYHQLLTVHISQLNWESKEDVDVVAFFEYMVSKEADPGFVAKAIINAKAKKKADEDAAEHARKKKKTLSKELETQESSTVASNTGLNQRSRRNTTSVTDKRRSERTLDKSVTKSTNLRRSPRKNEKVIHTTHTLHKH